MTSKNLFFKLIWQDFKKRIWCPIIIFLVYFLGMEIRLLNCFGYMEKYPSAYDYTKTQFLANHFFAPDTNYTITYITMLVGAMCAWSGYAYLHSRKQLDTYHSMPVRREMLFFGRYVSGLLMYAIPFVIHTFICLLIGMTKGAFSGHGVVNAIGLLGVQTLCFLLVYSLCIVAMCLTGNMIISVLGSCVLVGYSTILSFLKNVLYDTFFYTYISSFGEEVYAFSPIGMLVALNRMANDYRETHIEFGYSCMIRYSLVMLLAISFFTTVGVLLHRKRATEAAGKSIAFPITEPFIKAMVVLPVSLFSGFIIRDIADYNAFSWFVFGVVFGFLVSAIVMEIIFRQDIKCAFHHWKQFIFNGACLTLMIVIFKYDVLGYNTYVPNEEELSGCAVSFVGLMNIDLQEQEEKNAYRFIDAREYRFEHMNVVDNPSALALAKKAAAEGLKVGEYDYYEGIEASADFQEQLMREENYRCVSFAFTKKNGKKVYRQYHIDISDEETLSLMADIFNDANYKLGAFPILTNGWQKEYSEVNCTNNAFTDSIKLSPERQARLLEVYQSDMMNLTLEEVMNVVPVGNITFLERITKNSYGGYEDGYKIYPTFVATIELLKQYGFDCTETLPVDKVKKMMVGRYLESYTNIVDGENVVVNYEDEIALSYSDKESIGTVLPMVVNEELLYGLSYFIDLNSEDVNVTLYYDEDGVERSNRYGIYNGEMPDFIEEDFDKKIEEIKMGDIIE